MAIVTLRDLYVAELHELSDVEHQILQELPGMAARATSAELQTAFEQHYEQTQIHIDRLDLLLRQLNERSQGGGCEGIRGLVHDAHRCAAEAERGEVLDATLIAVAQRIEHYEIAAYGCARTHAHVLGDSQAARLLQQTLDEERLADRRLTEIAQRGINQGAGEDLVEHSTTYRSRLRYIAASDVSAFPYAASRISNADGDELGHIDGFIVDGDTGRPLYHVVDSGGWFFGRRYVLPVAQLESAATPGSLRTPLTREQLRRYPEFNPSAFLAMDDDDAARYERRLINAVLPYRHASARYERPRYEQLPIYQPPPWLTAATGLAKSGMFGQRSRRGAAAPGEWVAPEPSSPVPSDKSPGTTPPPAPHDDQPEAEHINRITGPENELIAARGEAAERSNEAAQRASNDRRIEKYPDR
jgi:ferritin-like metal-binding protein YciE